MLHHVGKHNDLGFNSFYRATSCLKVVPLGIPHISKKLSFLISELAIATLKLTSDLFYIFAVIIVDDGSHNIFIKVPGKMPRFAQVILIFWSQNNVGHLCDYFELSTTNVKVYPISWHAFPFYLGTRGANTSPGRI